MIKLANRLFCTWIHLDVKLHLKGIEKKIQDGELKINSNFFIEEYERVIRYSEYFISTIYSKPTSIGDLNSQSINDTAQLISNMFLGAYLKGVKKQDKDSLKLFLPKQQSNTLPKYFNNKDSDSLFNKGPLNQVIEAIFTSLRPNKLDNILVQRKEKFFHILPLPNPANYLYYLLHNCKVIIHDIQALSKEYGINFNRDGEIRCFYNSMNISLHYFCIYGRSHLNKKERLLVFALSALHPAQDDLIDDIGCSEMDAKAITEVLKGKKTAFSISESAKPIISLIKIIYRFFRPEKHPILVQIFLELHKWQLVSKKQKGILNGISGEELLLISFMKGGYAFALYGYVSQGRMSISQFEHYFAMGAIFQLMDDLHDIDDDLENDIMTVFTQYVKNGENIDNAMYGLISMQRCFEKQIGESKDFRYPVLIRFIELFGARYDSFRFYCINQDRFSTEFNKNIMYQFPFQIEELIKFFSYSREYETLDNYIKVIHEIETKVRELLQ